MTAATNLGAFVEQVRARRAADGRPDRIEADSLYRILDGLLARGAVPAEAGTAQALARSTTTTPGDGGRDD